MISSTRRSDFREDKTLSSNNGKAPVSEVGEGVALALALALAGLKSKISSTIVDAVFILKDSVIALMTGSELV